MWTTSFSQHLLNSYFQVCRRNHRFKTQNGLAVLGDQEFAEVPTDGIALVEACAGLLVDLVKHCRKLLGAFGIAFERSLLFQVGVATTLSQKEVVWGVTTTRL